MKTRTIYRYYYNDAGYIEYKYQIYENDRVTVNLDMPFVDSTENIDINQKKYNVAQNRFVNRQDSAPTRATIKR